MKTLLTFLFGLFLVSEAGAVEKAFKGHSPTYQFNVGGLTGLGVVDSRPGYSLLGTAAVKIINRGFVEDINNQVFLEVAFGPLFVGGGTAFQYSFHLRWDFVKDEDWTFYAVGGLGGVITGSSYSPIPLGPAKASSMFYPRLGLGAMWGLFSVASLRFEISHELLAMGVVFLL